MRHVPKWNEPLNKSPFKKCGGIGCGVIPIYRLGEFAPTPIKSMTYERFTDLIYSTTPYISDRLILDNSYLQRLRDVYVTLTTRSCLSTANASSCLLILISALSVTVIDVA